MEVIVKNNQISKTHISKMAYNHINNILACNIDGNDTILFFALDPETMTFIELFKGMSKPPGSKISMSWSPDGKYLALAAGNIEIWQFKDGRIKPVKTFQEDFIEIKIIEWSVDSQCYACGGISRTNTIKIRNIETGKMRQIQLPQRQTISSISFDPYGKYLFLLLRNNILEIYSVLNYEKYKSVRLSPEGLKINPIKEIRVPSWSPDFGNFVCPSLDDSRINLVINLSRTKDFKAKNIFMGHCTSISCCKFNPKLYKWKGEITSIVAMGDSAGNVSFWRVGTKTDFQQPLLLSNSMQNSMQVVEDLEWDEKGEILMVNMMKKYVHIIKFVNKAKNFGVELSNDEMFALIRETYGASRATDVNKRQIEVFDMNTLGGIEEQKKVDESQKRQPEAPQSIVQKQAQSLNNITKTIEPSIPQQIPTTNPNAMQIQEQIIEEKIVEEKPNMPQSAPAPIQLQQQARNPLMMAPPILGESKNEYVKLSQQKVIIGKNNKKKIQPAMMVRKDQIGFIQPIMNQIPVMNTSQNSLNSIYFTNSMVQTFPSLQLPLITCIEKQIFLSKTRLLEIKRLNKATSLEIVDIAQNQEPISKRIFPSIVDYIHASEKLIYVINQQFLYVFDMELNPKELPFKVGAVHKFLANQSGVIYFINCEGYLIGFDHLNNANKTLTPVPLHLLLKENFHIENNQNTQLMIKEFTMTINCDVLITIECDKGSCKNKKKRFLYDIKKNGWSRLELKEGVLESGFSIRVTDSEQNVVKNFFTSLCPSLREKANNTRQNPLVLKQKSQPLIGVISSEEQGMIYYQKYQKDRSKFYECLIEYLNSLKGEHKNRELRNAVNKYFFDSKSLNFIRDTQERHKVWEKVVKSVSGSIIEEFMINSQKGQPIDLE